jgi:very-short-patch-repair endonuclease
VPNEKLHRIHPATLKRARALRRPQTPAEQKLWAHLRGKQLCGLKFRRQQPVGRFIVDFYCARHRLIVEIDGDVHAYQVESDQARTEWLEQKGYRVIRFTNIQVLNQTDAVLEEIVRNCEPPTDA